MELKYEKVIFGLTINDLLLWCDDNVDGQIWLPLVRI